MELFLIILLYILIIFFDYIPIIKKGEKRLNILYSTLLTISFCVLVLSSLNLTKPVISDFIVQTIENFFNIK